MIKICLVLLLPVLFISCKKDKVSRPAANICTQSWMVDNLDVEVYSNGDTIPYIEDYAAWISATTGAYCRSNNDPMGVRLYNWYAISDPRGLAPAGWHIATKEEWMVLNDYLNEYGPVVNDSYIEAVRYYGFKNLPLDRRENTGSDPGFTFSHSFEAWISAENPEFVSAEDQGPFYLGGAYSDKSTGLAVRCVKDK